MTPDATHSYITSTHIATHGYTEGVSLDDLAAANNALAADIQRQYARRAELIAAARASGHTWKEIADALSMTVHGAIKASRMSDPT